MDPQPIEFTYDVQLQPGELLSLPKDAQGIVGPGHWVVSIRQANADAPASSPRDHAAFLNGYSSEDEGLFDDYPAG